MEYVPDLVFIFGFGALSFILSIALAPTFIKLLHAFKMGKKLRENATTGEKASIFNMLHGSKEGTPTMGGFLVWGSAVIVVLFSRFLSYIGVIDRSLLQRTETWLVVLSLVAFGIIGLVDDWFNIKGLGKSKGLDVKPKLFLVTVLALVGALWFHLKLEWTYLHVPGVGDFEIGFWYVPLFMMVILASANAVNITDGLDGLSGGLLAIAYVAFGIISFADGQPFLAALCAVIVGALTGFLWFNVPPAKFYMGDTGATALGATLGVIAMLTDSALILIIIGGIFVLETLSSAIQLFSKKYFKRKVFKIAPFHHHLEACGWEECTVVMRLWIIGAMLGVVGVILAIIGRGI